MKYQTLGIDYTKVFDVILPQDIDETNIKNIIYIISQLGKINPKPFKDKINANEKEINANEKEINANEKEINANEKESKSKSTKSKSPKSFIKQKYQLNHEIICLQTIQSVIQLLSQLTRKQIDDELQTSINTSINIFKVYNSKGAIGVLEDIQNNPQKLKNIKAIINIITQPKIDSGDAVAEIINNVAKITKGASEMSLIEDASAMSLIEDAAAMDLIKLMHSGMVISKWWSRKDFKNFLEFCKHILNIIWLYCTNKTVKSIIHNYESIKNKIQKIKNEIQKIKNDYENFANTGFDMKFIKKDWSNDTIIKALLIPIQKITNTLDKIKMIDAVLGAEIFKIQTEDIKDSSFQYTTEEILQNYYTKCTADYTTILQYIMSSNAQNEIMKFLKQLDDKGSVTIKNPNGDLDTLTEAKVLKILEKHQKYYKELGDNFKSCSNERIKTMIVDGLSTNLASKLKPKLGEKFIDDLKNKINSIIENNKKIIDGQINKIKDEQINKIKAKKSLNQVCDIENQNLQIQSFTGQETARRNQEQSPSNAEEKKKQEVVKFTTT